MLMTLLNLGEAKRNFGGVFPLMKRLLAELAEQHLLLVELKIYLSIS